MVPYRALGQCTRMDPTTSNHCNAEAVFEARWSMLPATAGFVEGFCRRHGIGAEDALRLTLVVEELFSNSLRHGYGKESAETIRIELSAGRDGVRLCYEDRAPRFDPLAQMSSPAAHLADPIETWPVGGLGMHLLGQLVSNARYAYEDGSNRLLLTLPRRA